MPTCSRSSSITSPVTGSKCCRCSTSSPNRTTRKAVSAYAGKISSVSPRTRKVPRDSAVSLRVVLDRDELSQQRVAVDHLALAERLQVLVVGLGRTEAVDAGDAGDDQHIAAREQRRGRRVPEAVDLLVDRRVLLDVEVLARDVCLGLVVVVIGDEVLDRVAREVGPKLVAQLGRERLVVGDHERRLLHRLDRRGHRHRLAGAGRPE